MQFKSFKNYYLLLFRFFIFIVPAGSPAVLYSNPFWYIPEASLYDHHLTNPAFIAHDSLLQFSAYGNMMWTSIQDSPVDIMIKSIVTADKINSGFSFGYFYTSWGQSEENGFNIGYSYDLKIKNDFVCKAGIDYEFDYVNIPAFTDPFEPFSYPGAKNFSHFLDLGIAAQLYHFTLGLSINYLLASISVPDSMFLVRSGYQFSTLIVNYDFDLIGKWALILQVNYKYWNFRNNHRDIWRDLYFSCFADFDNQYKLGVTVHKPDSLRMGEGWLMLSGAVNITPYINVLIFLNPGFHMPYSRDSGWNLSGRLSVSL